MSYGLYERIRGIDKWPFASATVNAVEQLSGGGRGGACRRISFTFQDNESYVGGELKVDSSTSIYELSRGDSFDLQYNPKRSTQIYCEESASATQTIGRIILIVGVTFTAVVILIQLFNK
jgi:hypothetical protein